MCPKTNVKVRASIMAGLLFAIVASPQLFQVMQSILGGLVTIASSSGVPTFLGLVLHSAVYAIIVYFLMYYKKEGFSCPPDKPHWNGSQCSKKKLPWAGSTMGGKYGRYSKKTSTSRLDPNDPYGDKKLLADKFPYWGWGANTGLRCIHNDNTKCFTHYVNGKLVMKRPGS